MQLGNDRLEQQQYQRQEGDVKDQAKQWLSAGRDWLSGASRKVAQAVKETQAQINNRLEDLDARHSQGSILAFSKSWLGSFCMLKEMVLPTVVCQPVYPIPETNLSSLLYDSLMCEVHIHLLIGLLSQCCGQAPLKDSARSNAGGQQGSPPKRSSQSRRQAGDATDAHADGDVTGIPQYYFEWAATIGDLPGHEQGMTLAAMPEEDASNIRRILRHKAPRQSQELTEDAMLAAAKQHFPEVAFT